MPGIVLRFSRMGQPRAPFTTLFRTRGMADIVPPKRYDYTQRISQLASESKSTEAFRTLEQMRKEKQRPHVVAYNSLIEMCCRTQRIDRALRLLEEMTEDQIAPNLVTFSTLVHHCALNSQFKSYLQPLLDDMKRHGLQPNVVTFTSIVSALAKQGRWEEAIQLLTYMRKNNTPPNVITYNSLLHSCSTSPKAMDTAFVVLGEMQKAAVRANIITFNTMVHICCQAGQLNRAMALYRGLERFQLTPDVKTFNTLISAHGKEKKLAMVLSLYQEMEKLRIMPTVVTRNSLLSAYHNAADYQAAVELFFDIKQRALPLDHFSYTLAIACLGKLGRMDECIRLFHELLQGDTKPDLKVLSSLLNATLENKDAAPQVVQTLQKAVRTLSTEALSQRTTKLYASAVLCFVTNNPEGYEEHKKTLRQLGVSLNPYNHAQFLKTATQKK